MAIKIIKNIIGSKITRSEAIREKQDRLYEILSKDISMGIITFLPVLALLTIVTYIPIAWAIAGSFHGLSAYHREWPWVGLANFQSVLFDPTFQVALWRGAIFAGASVVLQLVVGTGFALLLNKKFKFNRLVRAIAFTPYLIPTALIAMVFVWMGNSNTGVLNQILVDLGIISEYRAWFGERQLAMPAVIIASSWKFSIFVTIMVLARLQSIPQDHYEAAKMAGASAYQRFWDITLPNLKGVIFIVLLLRSVWMFNKFDVIWVLTRGGPRDATETAPIYIYEIAFGQGRLGEGLAGSTILFVLLVGAAIIYFWVFKPSESVRVEK